MATEGAEAREMDVPCFFMLCNDRTEKECLDRMLFGDRANQFESMRAIQAGHFGFLLNMSTNELLGVFQAKGPAAMNIDRHAWAGKFPAQVRVKQVGGLQRVPEAVGKLSSIVELRALETASDVYVVPTSKTHGGNITDGVLSLFNMPDQASGAG